MAADATHPDGGLDFRFKWMERRLDETTERAVHNSQLIRDLEKGQAVDQQILHEVRDDVLQLKRTLDRLVWAIVGLALTVAGSAIGIAITAGAGG